MVQIGGRKTFTITSKVEFIPSVDGESVEVTINSLPFGFDETMEKLLPSPEPKKVIRRDAKGKPVTKPGTSQLYMDEDRDDPSFKLQEKMRTRQQAAFIIYYGTQVGGDFEWDTDLKEDDGEKFFQAIYDELKLANIGAGYIANLTQEIMKISGVDQERINEVKAVFLASEESQATPAL